MRGKEELIPHAARAGQWLEEQSWASALPSLGLRTRSPVQNFLLWVSLQLLLQQQQREEFVVAGRDSLPTGREGRKRAAAGGRRHGIACLDRRGWEVPLPRNAFGTPEGCGGAADVCIPSASRQQYVPYDSARGGRQGSSAGWMPMPHPPLPESTLGTPDDAKDTEGVHSVAYSIRQHGALLSGSVNVYHGDAVRSPLGELGDLGEFASLPPRLKAER